MNTVIINTQTREVIDFIKHKATIPGLSEGLVFCYTAYESLEACVGKVDEIMETDATGLRKREYDRESLTLGNVLDELCRGLQSCIDSGVIVSPEVLTMLSKRQDVKSKFPKIKGDA